MIELDKLTIRPFDPQDQDQACQLILSGLEERWGFLDPAKNPDLMDIDSSYREGLFLVAVLEEEIVGTGALIPEQEGTCRIVRMSVKRSLRNCGIGSTLLRSLVSRAKTSGYQAVVLETTASWQDAVDFYLRSGFQSLGVKDGDHHFIKSIAE